MKFLHLSDIHIGKSVNGFSMIDEQVNAFKQILDYAKIEEVQAVAIAGDIYDRAVPGIEAVRIFDDFLTELAEQNVAVLLISGNHDSPERLNFASRLLSDKNLYIHSVYQGVFEPVTLTDEFGEVNFWLLPFIKPATVRSFFPDTEIENYTDAVRAVMQSAQFNDSCRNILVSHQFYLTSGIIPLRSESEIESVGGLDAVDTDCLLPFDYIALGHLHGSQRIGKETIRYAGSPIKYSFSETNQKKSINLIEIKEKGNVVITHLPIIPIHDMLEIRGKFEEVLNYEMSSKVDSNDYLRITLIDDDEILDLMERIRKVYPNTMVLTFDNKRTQINLAEVTADMENAEKLSPFDLFCEFFLKTTGATLTSEQIEIVREMLDGEEIFK
ncbi:MAG: exonuclease SbcCD subunit D [Ruminococcus sp.]|nr:exonuclease SbcCD subunit D [Ruminococcus sp.]